MSSAKSLPDYSLRLRYAWWRFLRKGKFVLGHDPLFLPIFMRLTPLGTSRQITEHTELVVEGFPRSSNTFTVFALEDAAHHRLRIASHVHHPAQVKLAVSRGVPTVLVVREPIATLASYLSFGQHGRPSTVLKEYAYYLRELVPYVDQVLICTFDEVVTNLTGIIDRINERFSMSIPPFDQSPENVDRVFEEIGRQHSLLYSRQDPVNVAPRPAAGRQRVSDRARAALLDPDNEGLLANAVSLYEYFAAKATQQREFYEALTSNQAAPINGRRSNRPSSPTARRRNAKQATPMTVSQSTDEDKE